jgi:hemerythrin
MSEQAMDESYLCWSPEFSVGIKKVDDQHKKIFTMINKLHKAIVTRENDAKAMENVIEEMASYVAYHFETEKSYLQQLPEFVGHEKQHWEFTKKTLQFASKYQRHPQEELLHEIVDFLAYWLKAHIIGTDIEQFATYRRQTGASVERLP